MKKVYDGDVGYEIRGFSDPLFNRQPLRRNDSDMKLEIPNGDLEHGKRVYTSSCATCHELDSDQYLGPAMRTVYLRRIGSQKKFNNYGLDLRSKRMFWTRQKLWEFLLNPEKLFPDTNMQLDGIQDNKTLASLIDYMQYLTVYTTSPPSNRKTPIF